MFNEEKKYVDKFIYEFNKTYPSVKIDYSYDAECEIFDIWHDSSSLQFENKDFLKQVGMLIKNILYDNEVFNISFGYDYSKTTKNIVKNYVFQYNTFSAIVPTTITLERSNTLKDFSYNTELKMDKNFLSDVFSKTTVQYIQQDIISRFNYKNIEGNTKISENQWLFVEENNRPEERLAA
jgi:hypothetical protein